MKKQTISNKEIINKLTKAGLVPESRFSVEISSTIWDYRSRSYASYRSFKIPLDVYTKVIGCKFTTKFKRGVMVRFNDRTTRSNTRRTKHQDVGDIYSWGHLGIGSGKVYVDFDELEDSGVNRNFYRPQNYELKKNVLTIGSKFIVNPYSAHKLAKHYKEMGYKIKGRNSYWAQDITSSSLYEKVILDGHGLLGPKKLINGTITEVYVHFMYPKWKQKREARYEVLFDTGAIGLFTGDRLDRVFDTDFDLDEKLCFCDKAKCNVHCTHKGLHIGTDECNKSCLFEQQQSCKVIYDYSQLCETTIQRGFIEDEEEKDGQDTGSTNF